jgi:hypothetical protein
MTSLLLDESMDHAIFTRPRLNRGKHELGFHTLCQVSGGEVHALPRPSCWVHRLADQSSEKLFQKKGLELIWTHFMCAPKKNMVLNACYPDHLVLCLNPYSVIYC